LVEIDCRSGKTNAPLWLKPSFLFDRSLSGCAIRMGVVKGNRSIDSRSPTHFIPQSITIRFKADRHSFSDARAFART
jgi:hypothetical protein